MATTTERLRSRTTAEPGRARQPRPVLWWAGAGAAFTALSVYVFAAWLIHDPGRTAVGHSAVPESMKAFALFIQIFAPTAMVGLLWFCLIRPWRRDGTPSLDGLIFAGTFTLVWQDCLANYSQYVYTYNSYYVNLGSWINYIPGWQAPNGQHFAEPILFSCLMYSAVFAGILFGSRNMRLAKRRWPRLGWIGLWGVAFMSVALLDFGELIFTTFGVWSYGGVDPRFTLFAGHYYQFPLYEPLIWGLGWSGMACLRYFVDDRRMALTDRGLDRVPVKGRTRVALRFLAIAGALNLSFLVLCNIPWQYMVTHQHSWPKDVTSRSYFMQGRCGSHTAYVCPGGGAPIFLDGGQHYGPDGHVVGTPASG
jgi:Spirocyclase AveC-like